MFDPADNFFKRFLKSPHHLWLAGLTLGVGFLSANVVVFGVCIGLYVLGWIHLPDTAMYKNWVQRHLDALAQQADSAKVQAFVARRTALINQLSRERRGRYQELGNVCQEIIRATQDSNQLEGDDPRLRKLDELMWTYLRLLVMEGSLAGFIATESQEGLPEEVAGCKNEIADLEKQVAGAPADSNVTIKQRLLDSKKEKLAALVKRQTRLEEATGQSDAGCPLASSSRVFTLDQGRRAFLSWNTNNRLLDGGLGSVRRHPGDLFLQVGPGRFVRPLPWGSPSALSLR